MLAIDNNEDTIAAFRGGDTTTAAHLSSGDVLPLAALLSLFALAYMIAQWVVEGGLTSLLFFAAEHPLAATAVLGGGVIASLVNYWD